MNKVLVAFALKQELAGWRRHGRFRHFMEVPFEVLETSIGEIEVFVTLVGTGAPQRENIEVLTKYLAPSVGVVAGVAAGLKPSWRPGDLFVPNLVAAGDGSAEISSNPELVDYAVRCGAKAASRLITVSHIARTVTEKEKLAILADAADMESFPLMRQWSEYGIPSIAVRVILDAVEMPMPLDFEAALDARGQVRIGRILAQLAGRLPLLPPVLSLARLNHRASLSLALLLNRFFEGLREPLRKIDAPLPAPVLQIGRRAIP